MIKNEMTSKEVNEMIKKNIALLFKTLTKEIKKTSRKCIFIKC